MKLLESKTQNCRDGTTICFQMHQHIADETTPESYTITCLMNGEPARVNGWTGYDYDDYTDRGEASKAFRYYIDQIKNK